MDESKKFEFFLIRYVPDLIKGEFTNIGLLMMGDGFANVRFAKDWRRVQLADYKADLDVLQAIANDITKRMSESSDREELLYSLKSSFSNLIQMSEVKGCITSDPAKELDVMASMYLEPLRPLPKQDLAKVKSASGKLHARMREAFEAAHVRELMVKDISMDEYTEPGNPLKLNCGYAVGEAFKCFHAFSMRRNLAVAYKLAETYPKFSREQQRRNQTTTFLTAVVDDDGGRERKQAHYAASLMRDTGIVVANISTMPEIARLAALELRA